MGESIGLDKSVGLRGETVWWASLAYPMKKPYAVCVFWIGIRRSTLQFVALSWEAGAAISHPSSCTYFRLFP